MLLKTSAYVKGYDGETKLMYFLIVPDELLEKYNDISNKASNSNLTVNPFTIKSFWKPVSLTLTSLGFFNIKKSYMSVVLHKIFQRIPK